MVSERISCGIDWAQDHHDVAVVDEQGVVICAERIGNDAAGLARLLEILAVHDPVDAPLEVAIETGRGLLVAGLRMAGRTVIAVNPPAVSRDRDRYRASRGKSDAFDATVLANILRTDRDAHRPLPQDSEQVRALLKAFFQLRSRHSSGAASIGWSRRAAAPSWPRPPPRRRRAP